MTNNNLSYVSGCSCPTELLAVYLDHLRAPFVWNLDSYVKDTTHMLNILDFFRFWEGEGQRSNFTMDIKSRYTVILVWTGLRRRPQNALFKRKRSCFAPDTAIGYTTTSKTITEKRSHSKTHSREEPFENDAI